MKKITLLLFLLEIFANAQFLDEKNVPLPAYIEKNWVDDSLQNLLAKESVRNDSVVSVFRNVLGKKTSETHSYRMSLTNQQKYKVVVFSPKVYSTNSVRYSGRYEVNELGIKRYWFNDNAVSETQYFTLYADARERYLAESGPFNQPENKVILGYSLLKVN